MHCRNSKKITPLESVKNDEFRQYLVGKDFCAVDRLLGLVVKMSASRVAVLGFCSRLCRGDFSVSSHTSYLKIGTPVVTLPGVWHCRVRAGTGWPGVSIL